ncbi:MAG: hypothetical protein IT371_02880 [Deltaproteobacteria bacterium]|nr:hypothetical protein [Deltaproteobacteria bacterium]
MLLRTVVRALLAGAVLCGVGCNTPQIPLPPPCFECLSSQVVDRTAGLVSLQGRSTPDMGGATVQVLNRRTGHGVIAPAQADGSFATRSFEAREGDSLVVDYTLGGEPSGPLCVLLAYDGPLRRCP